MRHIVYPLVVAALLACDDPEVEDKVLDVLQHGMVSAHVVCAVDPPCAPHPLLTPEQLQQFPCTFELGGDLLHRFEATRFIDGSALVAYGNGNNGPQRHTVKALRFIPRSDDDSTDLRLEFESNVGDRLASRFDNGDLTITYDFVDPQEDDVLLWSFDVESVCAGFNLEAF